MSDLAEVVSGEVVEHGTLADNEAIIKADLVSFVRVGRALAAIRDGRQYRQRGFDTFDEYCRTTWDFSRQHVNQTIASADVTTRVVKAGLPAPPSEFVARPLAKVLNEDGEQAVTNAWAQIVERYGGDKPVTATQVRRHLTLGANYTKAGWHELLGEVGDTLIRAEKQLSKVESELTRKPSADFADKADRYAQWAEHLSTRLRALKDGPG